MAREARGLFVSLPSFWIQDSYACLHLHGLPAEKERTCTLARLLIFLLRSFHMSIGFYIICTAMVEMIEAQLRFAPHLTIEILMHIHVIVHLIERLIERWIFIV